MDFAANLEKVSYIKHVFALLASLLGFNFWDGEIICFRVIVLCWYGFDYYLYTEQLVCGADNFALICSFYLSFDSVLIELRIVTLSLQDGFNEGISVILGP